MVGLEPTRYCYQGILPTTITFVTLFYQITGLLDYQLRFKKSVCGLDYAFTICSRKPYLHFPASIWRVFVYLSRFSAFR